MVVAAIQRHIGKHRKDLLKSCLTCRVLLNAKCLLQILHHSKQETDCLVLTQYTKFEIVVVVFEDFDLAKLLGEGCDKFDSAFN